MLLDKGNTKPIFMLFRLICQTLDFCVEYSTRIKFGNMTNMAYITTKISNVKVENG